MKRLLLIICILVLTGCSDQTNSDEEKVEVTISAASSLSESLLEIKKLFENENPSITLTFNFGGSGSLRRQVDQGAPIDLFISASEHDYRLLDEQDKFLKGSAILENYLVIIASKESDITSFKDFINNTSHQLAIGTPDAVPAGTYSKESLLKMGLWESLEGRLVFTKDVQQVLTYVANRAIDAGIVYFSDTINQEDIQIIEKVDRDLHTPIEYYMGLIDNDNNNLDAKETVFQYIKNHESLSIFESNGFTVHPSIRTN